MTNLDLPSGMILTLLVVVGILTIVAVIRSARLARTGQSSRLIDQQGGYPEGHWMGIGMGYGIALGAGFGVPIGIALDNIALGFALGPGIGVALGTAIGTALEQKHRDEIRPLTENERRTRIFATLVGVATLALGVLAMAAILLARNVG